MLPLVLLPGMDGTGILLREFTAAVAHDFKTVIVSYPDDPSLGYAELELVVRRALPRDEPFLLLGESFSGPIAISIAASNPQGLLGLILCCSFARNPHRLLPLATAALRPFPAVRVPLFVQRRSLFGGFASPKLVAELRNVRRLVSARSLKTRLEAVSSIDVSESLRRVIVPTLDLRANADRVVPRSCGDEIRNILPSVSAADLDAPHLLLQAVPHEALAAIKSFVRDRIEISI